MYQQGRFIKKGCVCPFEGDLLTSFGGQGPVGGKTLFHEWLGIPHHGCHLFVHVNGMTVVYVPLVGHRSGHLCLYGALLHNPVSHDNIFLVLSGPRVMPDQNN